MGLLTKRQKKGWCVGKANDQGMTSSVTLGNNMLHIKQRLRVGIGLQ